jgi:quercetin dioxygenase-like cupin family protein
MANEEVQGIRRIITGHDADGKAKVLIDGIATNIKQIGPGANSALMWTTDAMPADISIGPDIEDCGSRILGTPPPPNGTRFAINTIPPGSRGHMHRTETIDYIIVLSGEIDMDLDDSSVSLKAGDVMIQRGTNHAWMNRGSEPARIAFVLIDAVPLNLGKPVGRDANVKAD